MKKAEFKVDLVDEKSKVKVMKIVSALTGVDSISFDVKERKLTVVGDIDPVHIVGKLRKFCHTEIISVGPAKNPEKNKEEEKPKKQEEKNEDEDKDKDKKDPVAELVKAYKVYNPYMTQYYDGRSAEDDPNACTIM